MKVIQVQFFIRQLEKDIKDKDIFVIPQRIGL